MIPSIRTFPFHDHFVYYHPSLSPFSLFFFIYISTISSFPPLPLFPLPPPPPSFYRWSPQQWRSLPVSTFHLVRSINRLCHYRTVPSYSIFYVLQLSLPHCTIIKKHNLAVPSYSIYMIYVYIFHYENVQAYICFTLSSTNISLYTICWRNHITAQDCTKYCRYPLAQIIVHTM